MKITNFSELNLAEPIQRAVAAEDYTTPTPIQAECIPHLLEGRDLFGCAQTGTGKTAAFALPILNRLAQTRKPYASRSPRVLVLSPTRELAAQIGESFRTYGRFLNLRYAIVYGGVGQMPQVSAMARGVDVLIATPGRLLDLMNQGHVRLNQLEVFVLDEADRMLDMGFITDIRRIITALPEKRQTLFFSATIPETIVELADSLLVDPVKVEVAPVSSTADRIEQRVLFVDRGNKAALLGELLKNPDIDRVLVFTRTKSGANRVAQQLAKDNVRADAIHGNKSQTARQRALRDFRTGKIRVLVATDIAARGIDVDGISHVINFDLPMEPESYVHRIGRTARAGATGIALSFCDASERGYLRQIERLIRQTVTIVSDHPYPAKVTHAVAPPPRGGGNNARRGKAPVGRAAGGGRPPRQRSGNGSRPRMAADR